MHVVFVWVSLIRKYVSFLIDRQQNIHAFWQQIDLRSRQKFVTLPAILQPRIGMKYYDWVIPISKTENHVRKLCIVFECYDTEDTCDKKKMFDIVWKNFLRGKKNPDLLEYAVKMR